MPEEEDPDDLKTPEEHLQEIKDFIRMKGEEQAAEVSEAAQLKASIELELVKPSGR